LSLKNRRSWIRVAESLLGDELGAPEIGRLVLLIAYFNRRWARERPDTAAAATCARLSRGDLLTVMRTETLEEARSALAELAPRLELKLVERRGGFTEITWRKLAEYQAWTFQTRAPTGPRPGPARAPRRPRPGPEAAPTGPRGGPDRAPSDSDSDSDSVVVQESSTSSEESSYPELRTVRDAFASDGPADRRYVPLETEVPSKRDRAPGARSAAAASSVSALPSYLPGHDLPQPERARRWANVLGQEPGTLEEKVAFLTRELPLIEAEALASLGTGQRTRENARAKVRALVIRFWRNQAAKLGISQDPKRRATALEEAVRSVGNEEP
jgi:hypothetical protein